MNNFNNNHLNILNLPDEILFIIFEKLNKVDVFYSLVYVNRRFNRLVLDSLYIRDLDMTSITSINLLYDQNSSIDTQALSKICKNILPQIHHQVHKLTVEEYSMKQILLAGSYSQLYSLSVLNFQEETLYQYLTDDLILRNLLTKQITHLNIDIKTTGNKYSETALKMFALILSLCNKLIVLSFCDIFPTRVYSASIFCLFWKSCMPSTLVKLKIKVRILSDCLYLLDGPFVCLSTLIINVSSIYHPLEDIDPTKKVPKLKCFSLTTFDEIYEYDELIVPLLCRMINLEELKLYLPVVWLDSSYIDGIQLYDQVLIYMTQLKKFTFNIKTKVNNDNIRIELASNEYIRRSFIGRGYQQVASYVNTKPFACEDESECHIYSLPYDFEYFVDLNNCFQGGMFHKVRQLKMMDGIPFEHKLFKLISQDFPFLEFLHVSNNKSQKDKQHSSTLITFPYLKFLDLKWAHVDYAELFLLEKNMHLPRLVNLIMHFKSLTTITNNFTIDATHFNFGKLKSFDVLVPSARPGNFHLYFPLL